LRRRPRPKLGCGAKERRKKEIKTERRMSIHNFFAFTFETAYADN
jgi:hypothetical protein